MARFMLLWELDTARTPENPKEKKSQHLSFQDMVKKQIQDGLISEWGIFAGETRGFVIIEGNAVKLHTITASWVPFVKFKSNEILTIDEAKEATNSLPE